MGKLFVATLVASLSLATACAHHGGDDDDGSGVYSSVRVVPDPVTLVVALGGTATQDYKVLGTDDSGEHDITTKCSLGIDATFGTFSNATVTVGPQGGQTQISAICGQSTGSAILNVNLTSTTVVGTAPGNSDQLFGTATVGTSAAQTPTIEYPLNEAAAPLNLPSIEVQWTKASNDLFHIHLQSKFANLDVYTTDPQNTFSEADWISIANTAANDKLAITVEGLVQASPATKFASTPVNLNISKDTIDTSAIYWWSSSAGSIMSQVFGETSQPSVVKGNCSGCHALSRAGSRIGYSRCVAGDCGPGEWVGFLHYNDTTQTWNEVVNADQKAIPGTYTTFPPPGNPFPDDTQSVAMVTSMSGTFNLFDPDTGTAVASNISAVTPIAGHSSTMPDWSPDGTRVAFASANPGNSVDVANSSIAMMSYDHSSGSHVFGTPTVLVQQPITINSQSYNNLFFPSFSPDNSWLVFNAARATWRNFTDAKTAGQRIMLINPNGGPVMDLTNLNGTGDKDTTWPHWAPGATTDYYWLVFSSERDYGHEVTVNTTAGTPCVANGVKQCKQIWIGAISKASLMAGVPDPSFAPVWVPGQDKKNDNISPYWTVPPGLF